MHADTILRSVTLKDKTNRLWSYHDDKFYKFFILESYIKERIFNYGTGKYLYYEYITLDTQEKEITRKVMTFYEVFSSVGGILHLFMLVTRFFLSKYS